MLEGLLLPLPLILFLFSAETDLILNQTVRISLEFFPATFLPESRLWPLNVHVELQDRGLTLLPSLPFFHLNTSG